MIADGQVRMSEVLRTLTWHPTEWRFASRVVRALHWRIGASAVSVAPLSARWLREFEISCCKHTEHST